MSFKEVFLRYNPVKSLNVAIKLGISAALSIGLIMYLVITVSLEHMADIGFREAEYRGSYFYQPLYKIISHTQVTRGLTNSKLNGTSGLDANIQQNQQGALDGYGQLQAVIDEQGNFGNVEQQARALREQFVALNERASRGPASEVFAQYTEIVSSLRGLIIEVADNSNLTLDPELDTFYLMDFLTFRAHTTAEAAGVLRGRGSGIIASGNYDVAQLVPFAQILGSADAAGLMRSLDSIVNANPELASDINPVIADVQQSIDDFGGKVITIVQEQRSLSSAAEFFEAGTITIQAIYQGVDVTSALLTELLAERINAERGSRNIKYAVEFLVLAIALWVFIATIVSILDSLQLTVSSLGRIAGGDFSQPLTVSTTDEFATLASTLNDTQQQLNDNIERERKQALETSRIKSALDVADTAVMLADNELNINYLNQAAADLMSRRGEQLKTELPSLNYHNLLGVNVDQFHKNPSHQRTLLAGLTNTYKSEIAVAGLSFNLTATPLFDDEGRRSGTVIEWEDVTEELAKLKELERVAQENTRIRQALDNVSTNTMIADSNLNIVYANSAITTMLGSHQAELKTALPHFDASDMIGKSIDSFHSNPDHQQHILKSLSGAHHAQIEVAGLHFALTANPVFGEDRERIGTVIEWVDKTLEVTTEREVDDIIRSASHGDLTKRIEETGKKDFFLTLSKGLNQLLNISEGVVSDTARVFSALAHGDLSQKIERSYEGAFGELKNDANATIEKLLEVTSQIRESATTVTSGAEEISQGNADLSARTESQASNLEETAASMEQMTGSVKSSAENAIQANGIASKTADLANHGGTVVKDAVNAMQAINESSKHIADIIGVIDEIAFQTNLLALNAAVEAARAGEQGRGFAVVASEVRNLAQRSAGAAKEIKDLIRDSVEKVSEGSVLVNRSGETLEQIVTSVTEVTAMVADISSAASEQSSGIDQVNKAVSSMDEMTQQNAALVEEVTAAGQQMAEQARRLLTLVSFFGGGMEEQPQASVGSPNKNADSKGMSTPVTSKPTTASSSTKAALAVTKSPTVSAASQNLEHDSDDGDWEEF